VVHEYRLPSSANVAVSTVVIATTIEAARVAPQSPGAGDRWSEVHDLVHPVEAFRAVRDEQHRATFRRRQHVLDQTLCGRGIEVRRRLVEDEHLRVGKERACDTQPLALPA
jgi:hypothetical protein